MKIRTVAALAAGALSLFLIAGEALRSQNSIVPTMPPGTNDNSAASTAFVQSAITGSGAITALTGDVAASGPGSAAATIQPGVVTGAKIASATVTGGNIAGGTIANGNLAAMTQNAVKAAATSTAVADVVLPSCSTNNSALQWTTNTGFGCAPNMARLDQADQTVTGGGNVTSLSLSTGNVTIDCGARPLQSITNNGAYTITAPANDGSCILLVTNGASAGATTFSGFSVGSSTGDALTTTNAQKFSISIWRINGTSGYRVAAHQ